MIHHPRTPFVWSDNVIGGLVAWLYIPVLVWLANIFGSCWCRKSSIHIAAAVICMILPPVWQFTKALKGVKSFVFKKVYFAGGRLQFTCYAYDWLFRMEMIFLFQQWQVLILKLFIFIQTHIVKLMPTIELIVLETSFWEFSSCHCFRNLLGASPTLPWTRV